jgi:hypothetical protein
MEVERSSLDFFVFALRTSCDASRLSTFWEQKSAMLASAVEGQAECMSIAAPICGNRFGVIVACSQRVSAMAQWANSRAAPLVGGD